MSVEPTKTAGRLYLYLAAALGLVALAVVTLAALIAQGRDMVPIGREGLSAHLRAFRRCVEFHCVQSASEGGGAHLCVAAPV